MLAIAVVGSNSLALGPIASSVARSFPNTSAPDVMVASALFGLGTALGALLLAPRADQFGLAKALQLSLMLSMIGFAITASAPTLLLLCLGQTLAGIATGVILPCTYSLAAEIAPKGKENETLGRVLLGWMLSMVVGVSVASVIADALHWRLVYASLVAITATVVVGIARMKVKLSDHRASDTQPPSIEEFSDRVPEPDTGNTSGSTQALWLALKVPGVIAGLLSVIAFMIAFYGVYSFIGTHITLTLGSSTVLGGVTALMYGVGFGLATPLDRWLDRYSATYSRAVVFSILVFIYLGLAAASVSVLTLTIMCLAWGAINHLGLNLLIARLTAIDPSRRAAIMGLYSAATYLAMFFGTLLFKTLFEATGFWVLGLAGAVCILPLALIALHQSQQHRRDISTA